MEKLSIREIVLATGGQLLCGNEQQEVIDVVTDSRIIGEKMFFIPLEGERFDGHDFICQALKKGAVGCVVHKDIDTTPYKEKCILKVNDTLKALQDIARYYRNQFSVPFIAITGSVGKTTTKDMIACVLEQKYHVLKTKGNFNNEIGLPLTVFGLDSTHDIGVTEMGMSGFGEISRLVSIVSPKTAVITNIGQSHIEKLGSQQNILKAKMEVFEAFDENSLAILNGDDPLLFGLRGKLKFRTFYYGIFNQECDLLARDIVYHGEQGSSFRVNIGGQDRMMNVPVMGEHNIYNALAAIAIAMEYKIDFDGIVNGIMSFRPGKMRMNLLEVNGIKIINDCYNASPASMKAAIGILKQLENRSRTIAVLGDMLEMGDWAPEAHKKVGENVVDQKVDYLITVGHYGKEIAVGAVKAGMPSENVYHFHSNKEVICFLQDFLKPQDAVLIKGSRGMKMEEIADYIQGHYSA